MWWTVLKESISDEDKKEIHTQLYKKLVERINHSFCVSLYRHGYKNFGLEKNPEIFTTGIYRDMINIGNRPGEYLYVWEIDFDFNKFWDLAKEHIYKSLPKDLTITIQSFKEGDPKNQTLEEVLAWAKDRVERNDELADLFLLENHLTSPGVVAIADQYSMASLSDIEVRSILSSSVNYKAQYDIFYRKLLDDYNDNFKKIMPILLKSLPSKEHIEYALRAKDLEPPASTVGIYIAPKDLSWYKHTNTFYSDHIPDERGVYNFISGGTRMLGKRAQWIVYPRLKSRSGGGVRGPDGTVGLGSQYWNYDGLLWMQSVEDEDSFLINVDTIGAHGVLGVCVNVRGTWIPFEEYDFATIKVKEKTSKEKAGLLTQRLFGTPADTDADEKNIELEKMKTERARVVFDFITSWEETSKGPQFGERTTLPRWTKVAIGLGRGGHSTECIYNKKILPRGDKVAALMSIQGITKENAEMQAQLNSAVRLAMRRPEPHIYPLEHTLKVLEDKFGFWDPTNEESNKRVLDYLEENNYMFKKNGEGVAQYNVDALMGRRR